MTIFKQSTNYTHQFLMVLSSDHVSPATGKAPVVKIGKAGATGVTATNSPATEVDSTNLPGVYKILWAAGDVSTLGSFWMQATAASCDNTDESHQVQTQLFPDLAINASGQAQIASSIKQNVALTGFTFLMTNSTTHVPQTGLTVTAQRSLGGAGFSPCANSVSELSNGLYTINLANTDTNSATVLLRFTATSADDLDILLVTQP